MARSPAHKPAINPATCETTGEHADGGTDGARRSIAAALRAFRESHWATDRALRFKALNELGGAFQTRTGGAGCGPLRGPRLRR